jgi:hypothetical protein
MHVTQVIAEEQLVPVWKGWGGGYRTVAEEHMIFVGMVYNFLSAHLCNSKSARLRI